MIALALALALNGGPIQDAKDTKLYELRVYTAAKDKLPDLLTRFRDHTTKLFEKHGITNVGYWVPVENKDNKLYYVVSFPDKAARAKAFAEFGADPDWQKAAKASEANGKLVDKIESTTMTVTDYSPKLKANVKKKPRLFELRIYKANPDKLGALNARFKDITIKLFKEHGIKDHVYWTPAETAQGSADTLICLVSHKDKETAEKKWKEFHEDPAWIKAKADTDANGSLINKVEAIYMTPVDFSTFK